MAKEIYQVQVALKGYKPKIWRRLMVPSDLLLSDFHIVIQVSMGWENEHLHQFIKDDIYYAEKVEDDFFQFDPDRNVDYSEMKISDLLTKEKEKIIYEYDFGDGWEHEILLEKILPADKTFKNPLCTDGKMSCPPEDCGGVWGYAGMLKILSQPDHKEYENYLEWLGEDFDPEHFDINLVNKKLMKMDFGPY